MQRLEQEKHILRRKLSEAESEGDIRAQELESDYNEIKSKMLAQVSDYENDLIILHSVLLIWDVGVWYIYRRE